MPVRASINSTSTRWPRRVSRLMRIASSRLPCRRNRRAGPGPAAHAGRQKALSSASSRGSTPRRRGRRGELGGGRHGRDCRRLTAIKRARRVAGSKTPRALLLEVLGRPGGVARLAARPSLPLALSISGSMPSAQLLGLTRVGGVGRRAPRALSPLPTPAGAGPGAKADALSRGPGRGGNTPTVSTRWLACCCRLSEAEALSSTRAAFCCVTWSSWPTAWLIWAMPRVCSCGGADLGNQTADLLYLIDDLGHGDAGIGHQRAAGLDVLHAGTDEGLDLARGLGRALRQARTSAATTAKPALARRPGRLDGCVQRQDVGLERDAVDHADDVGDLARAFAGWRSWSRPPGPPPSRPWPPIHWLGRPGSRRFARCRRCCARWRPAPPSRQRSVRGWRPAARCAGSGPSCRPRSRRSPSAWSRPRRARSA